MKQNNKVEEKEKLEQLITSNMWGLRCDKCDGGGWDYDVEEKCSQCGGCGIYDWKIEPLVSEISKLLLQAEEKGRREEREAIVRAYKQTTGIQSDLFINSLTPEKDSNV